MKYFIGSGVIEYTLQTTQAKTGKCPDNPLTDLNFYISDFFLNATRQHPDVDKDIDKLCEALSLVFALYTHPLTLIDFSNSSAANFQYNKNIKLSVTTRFNSNNSVSVSPAST